MDKKKLLEKRLKAFHSEVLAISEKNPELSVNPPTRNMYRSYVKQMKTIFPENEEVRNLIDITGIVITYADLSNLMGQLASLLDFLLKE